MSDFNTSSSTSSEETPQEVHERLTYEWDSLSPRVTLSAVSDELAQTASDLAELNDTIKNVRQKGYVYSADWEDKSRSAQSGWPSEQRSAKRELNQQAEILRQTADEVERLINRAERDHSRLDDLERKLNSFDTEVSSAKQRVRQAFQGTSDKIGGIYEEIEWVEFMLENLKDASFQLYPDENGVAACKAKWMSEKGEPEGLLYLTDQRIIYEQVEEIAKKKVLFVTTEKETVKELAWEAPIGAIDKASAEDKGGFVGFGVKELLTLNFDRHDKDAPEEVTLRFLDYADNEMWEGLIDLVKSGKLERAQSVGGAKADDAEISAIDPEKIPTECSSCGGKLPTVFKGMQQIECEFCGNVIHLG